MSSSFPQLPRAQRRTGITAIAAPLLFAVANSVWAFDQPRRTASPETIHHF